MLVGEELRFTARSLAVAPPGDLGGIEVQVRGGSGSTPWLEWVQRAERHLAPRPFHCYNG